MLRSILHKRESERQEIRKKILDLESRHRAVAYVLVDKCGGCGLCMDVCPNEAIQVEEQAMVDPWQCSACCACVRECPNEAMIITQHKIVG
jgi:ferredoxin